ncbi:MAG TPA: acetyl-CoA carboxylase biotin carboxyl carrier protein [Aurantimonas sp.]|uniref:Biotin carboxyl carrier protein of acetyl-CoA carboxylase n=1 Tax=Aurantimonas marianensis TaxID=2920428 RepID=A0A9X2H637_9HYPH|nr:acetyl-CoA carboxylase biotin carboxyl carrier protein [Aurantimonas marianensis]MCP3054493.1 acetyl-CoA carboxylase biotin carboxyl carrier protein [Aurantimonas marianensis]
MSNAENNVDPALVRELATILDDTDLTEIEVEHGSLRVRVSRQKDYVVGHPQPLTSAPSPDYGQPAAPAASQSGASPVNTPATTGPEPGTVPSPMVGTVYLSSAPGARHFVEIGQQVAEGETLLIIEAMKTMNQIPAPRAGKVVKILVENAQPVEYGEPLVVVA